MRVWQLAGDYIASDNVAYSTATPASGLTLVANTYVAAVGDTVLKYRQNEIWDLIEFLKTSAAANLDTARFPRPAYGANGGGTYFKSSLITTAFGMKQSITLVTSTDLTTVPITDEACVYWGIQVGTAGLDVNDVAKMATVSMDAAWEEIKQYYIGSIYASA